MTIRTPVERISKAMDESVAHLHPPSLTWRAKSDAVPDVKESLWARLDRVRRWEFWPAWAFYPPIVAYIAALGVRYRSPTLFTAANPMLEAGGFVGERKSECLLALMARAPEVVAPVEMLPIELGLEERMAMAEAFIQADAIFSGADQYPIVLKPNIGQRGRGVAVIRSASAMRSYLQKAPGDVLIQRHIAGEEFGVFIYRDPRTGRAQIFSIAHKQFPQVIGDGQSTMAQLIDADARARLIKPWLWTLWSERLSWVPAAGQGVALVEIGAHCRGSLFTNAGHLASPALTAFAEKVFAALPGYCFGRLDVRCPSSEALHAGRNIRILEVNGVTAEAAHIYHPGTPLWQGYATMFKQWALAFEIGQVNHANGARVTDPDELIWRAWRDRERAQDWF